MASWRENMRAGAWPDSGWDFVALCVIVGGAAITLVLAWMILWPPVGKGVLNG